ncbi:8-amino-7-oxononanoate synthase [Thermomonas sp.]|uniref:8-amino-7-oxononanoate synthase n=1 Tax=Thermomonas sp. TaxID=1971895 RepID=UPI0035B485C5
MQRLLTRRCSERGTQRDAAQRTRVRRIVTHRAGVHCEVDGRWLLNFCSNDYLGLSQHPALLAALHTATSSGGIASHLVCGQTAEHAALEHALAEWQQLPRALLFGSGYVANLAVLQALLDTGDVCVQDKLNHASLIDGARLSGCALKRYPHLDVEGAARQLATVGTGAALLATDGVFSMDGDVAPLRALATAARQHDALLYVDEAHAAGVLGEAGRGSTSAADLGAADVPLRLITFGKALGSVGAAVAGDADVIEHLLQTARGGIYTTAMLPAQAAATQAAIAIVASAEGTALRQRLQENIAQFREGALRLGLPLLPSTTAIQPLLVGDDGAALARSRALEAQGHWVAAIRPPTVPEGSARLRITLSALHTPQHIAGLLEALARQRIPA